MPDAKGIAVDDTTGQPIAGATIVISQQTVIAGATAPPSGSKPWPSATSAADGSFDVQNVPPSRNRDERFDTVNCDRTRDREGQIAHEYVSPPFTDGDRHSLSLNQCGQGQVYIGTVTTDRTAALLPKVQSSADATS